MKWGITFCPYNYVLRMLLRKSMPGQRHQNLGLLLRTVLTPGGLPGFFNTGLRWMGKVMYGINLNKAAPIDVVSEIEPPVLFIHCESDTTIPSEHSPGHWRASGQTPEMLWLVNGPGGRSHL